ELTEKMTNPKLMQELKAAGLKPFTNGKEADIWGADATAVILKNHAPDLTLFHIIEVDHQQHGFGRDSQEVKQALGFVDQQIKKIVDSVDLKTTCVLIVGD